MKVDLGAPDADNNRFPLALSYNRESWSAWWTYTDRNSAKDFYRTRTHLKAEGLFQIEESEKLQPRLTTAKITHLGMTETREFSLETPKTISQIIMFYGMKKENDNAISQFKKIKKEYLVTVEGIARTQGQLASKEIGRDGPFIAYDDGTVLDTRTNLMWSSEDNGSNINWSDAKSYCRNYRGGGYSNWRMPTQDELAWLYDESKKYEIGGNWYVHLTKLIRVSQAWIWSSETSGPFHAKHFSFFKDGGRLSTPTDYANGRRALPVRDVKLETPPTNIAVSQPIPIEEKKSPPIEHERSLIRAYCDELKSSLATQDPELNLTGKLITTDNIEYEIVQFGRKGQYRKYYVPTPNVPNITKYSTCGDIPFYQVSKIESSTDASKINAKLRITLKNGKQYVPKNHWLAYVRNEKYSTALTASKYDHEGDSWLWLLVKDKSLKDPVELRFDPLKIKTLITEGVGLPSFKRK